MRPVLAAAAVIVVLGAGAVAAFALTGGGGTPSPSPARTPRAAALRFLDGYVEPDGRVVRRDQGGDTVSEAQAYALLLSAATGDRARFARVWGWTRSHLQRPDGLLAWSWADGKVVSADPAADADLDAARALQLAGQRFHVAAYRAAAHRLSGGILDHETVTSGGEPVLAPGPWARTTRLLNPSYFSPRAYTALKAADSRWAGVAMASRRLVDKLTAGALPPDWAQLRASGIVPAGPPSGGAPPRYGYDAVRVALRYEESCHPEDRALAARLWPRLRGAPGSPTRGLDGSAQGSGEDPTALTGAAAAASAAGDRRAASGLLDRADAAVQAHPSYYGSAWVALARTMLQTNELGRCR